MEPGQSIMCARKETIGDAPPGSYVLFLVRVPKIEAEAGYVLRAAYGEVIHRLTLAAANPAARVKLYSTGATLGVPGGQPIVLLEGDRPGGSDPWACLRGSRSMLQDAAAEYGQGSWEELPLAAESDVVTPPEPSEPRKRITVSVEGFSPEPKRQQTAKTERPELPAKQPADVPGSSTGPTQLQPCDEDSDEQTVIMLTYLRTKSDNTYVPALKRIAGAADIVLTAKQTETLDGVSSRLCKAVEKFIEEFTETKTLVKLLAQEVEKIALEVIPESARMLVERLSKQLAKAAQPENGKFVTAVKLMGDELEERSSALVPELRKEGERLSQRKSNATQQELLSALAKQRPMLQPAALGGMHPQPGSGSAWGHGQHAAPARQGANPKPRADAPTGPQQRQQQEPRKPARELSEEVKKQLKDNNMCVQYHEGPACSFKNCRFSHLGTPMWQGGNPLA